MPMLCMQGLATSSSSCMAVERTAAIAPLHPLSIEPCEPAVLRRLYQQMLYLRVASGALAGRLMAFCPKQRWLLLNARAHTPMSQSCDSLAPAAGGCDHNQAAQVLACLHQHGVHVPTANRDPVDIGSFELQQSAVHQGQAHRQSFLVIKGQHLLPVLGLQIASLVLAASEQSIRNQLRCPISNLKSHK